MDNVIDTANMETLNTEGHEPITKEQIQELLENGKDIMFGWVPSYVAVEHPSGVNELSIPKDYLDEKRESVITEMLKHAPEQEDLDDLLIPYYSRGSISQCSELAGYDPSFLRKVRNKEKSLLREHLYVICIFYRLSEPEAIEMFRRCKDVQPLSYDDEYDLVFFHHLRASSKETRSYYMQQLRFDLVTVRNMEKAGLLKKPSI